MLHVPRAVRATHLPLHHNRLQTIIYRVYVAVIVSRLACYVIKNGLKGSKKTPLRSDLGVFEAD
jgi:hypothetical protein